MDLKYEPKLTQDNVKPSHSLPKISYKDFKLTLSGVRENYDEFIANHNGTDLNASHFPKAEENIPAKFFD